MKKASKATDATFFKLFVIFKGQWGHWGQSSKVLKFHRDFLQFNPLISQFSFRNRVFFSPNLIQVINWLVTNELWGQKMKFWKAREMMKNSRPLVWLPQLWYQKWFGNHQVVANGIDALGRSHFQIMASVQFPRWVVLLQTLSWLPNKERTRRLQRRVAPHVADTLATRLARGRDPRASKIPCHHTAHHA